MRKSTIAISSLLLITALIDGASSRGISAQSGQQTPPKPVDPQPPVTFKVEINYVEIDAVVTDQQGNFVRNLTKDDFLVSEQGKPQSVSVFSLVDIPIEKADPPLFKAKVIEPDVRSNRKDYDGRVFVLVLDDLNTHFSRTPRVKLAARQFVERYLGANDIAAVVQTGGGKSTGQEFTGSRERLLRAIDTFMGQKERSATLEKIDDYQRLRSMQSSDLPRDPIEALRVHKARNTLTTLKNVADYMAGIRGRRKAVVFFSEGVDYDVYDAVTNRYATDIRSYAQDAIAAATRSNVSFYAVDPRGLGGFDDAAELSSIPEDTSLGLGVMSMQRELMISQDSLRTISDETGGFAAVNRNDFGTSFNRIIQDNSSYYVLGYYSTDTRRDGQFRSLNVRVKNTNLQVRARKGYVAPKGRPPAGTPAPPGIAASIAMREALDSPLPVTGLGVTAFAAPMAGAAAAKSKASVLLVVELEAGALKFKEEGGMFLNDVELAIIATDEGGKIRDGAKDTAQLKLRPETYEAVMKNGVRLTRRLDLAPGRYQLRIGARDSVTGRIGLVLYDLDVPDFSKGELTMGGLLLTSAYSSRIPTANPDKDFKEIMPASPTALRVFPTGDQLSIAIDVYDNRASTPHRVEIATTVTADSGTTVFSSRDERRSEELKGGNTFGHVAAIPLKDVAPGRYVLRVEAKSTLSSGANAARELEFTVR